MGSKSQVSPPRSAVREFFSSLAGMITIGLAAGLILCSPFFIYWQRSSPETRAASPGAAPPQPPTPPSQVPIKTESKQQTTSVDQFLPTPEQSTTTHNAESANDLQSSNLSEREQIDVVLKFRLLGRPAEEEKVLRNPRSPEAKVLRSLIIQQDSAELRGSGMTTFDRSEAEKLATEALPKLSAEAESKPLSMYLLSCLYWSGLGVPKDLHQAFRLSSGNERKVLTHPERLILTHLVLQDSRSGQGRQFRFTPPFGSSWTSSTRESGSSRRSSRRSGNDASGGPKAPRSSARPGRSGSTR